jgi:adenylate cyclase
MNDTPGPRLRPTGSLLVTKVRSSQIRTACVTVLFADLRGYTGMVERLPAAQVVPLLDEFFDVLGTSAKKFGGVVYHMAGDGIMAGFGVHAESSNGAAQALAAGHSMLKSFEPLADRWRRELAIEAGIGIGIHLGEVAFGVLGPAKRKTTTLVGDTVNVAARLCSRARAGEVLFSCTVAAALSISADAKGGEASTSFLQLPQFELRGRRGPIDIWCVPAAERLAI